ncbi:hypothetical protein Cgig2_008332 [Carnegiea gigantea]|uniref:Uncharacterized protein n=1 Tax=Carnegiea gigantea TaxID=171969 RepID=A0A9Q1K7D3_9CARY|nr:hypothetical protein Cgig2_008332 [Carnegiea gigantea]
MEKSALNYARFLIEMPLEGLFPDYIELPNDYDILMRQNMVFEWKPLKCTHCHVLGHSEADCRKKNTLRTKWRRVKRDDPVNHTPIEDGFIRVLNKPAARQTHAKSLPPPTTSNVFQEFMEIEYSIHCKAAQVISQRHFYITLVYGMNKSTLKDPTLRRTDLSHFRLMNHL